MGRIPRHALLLSLAAGMAVLPVVIVALTMAAWPGRHPHVTAFAVAAAFGAVFGLLWPAWSWRWGIATSAGLWMYFGFVLVALAVDRQFAWTPGVDAVVSLLAACSAAFAGSRLSPRSRRMDPGTGGPSPC